MKIIRNVKTSVLLSMFLGLMLLICISAAASAWALPAVFAEEVGIEAASLPQSYQRTMMVWAETSETPPSITLRWGQPPSAGNINIFRKSRDSSTWGSPIATLPNSARYFSDADVQVGQAYEYRVSNGENEGYIFAGIRVAATQHRGTVVLLVEAERADALTDALDIFKLDLVGDGWTVKRHNVSRNASPESARALIQADYNADPDNVQAVFLLGHIPIFFTGTQEFAQAPDGHANRPLAADAFYGSMTGEWVSFYTETIAADVELMVGRVDFDGINGFGKDASELLIQYLERNHRYRHGLMQASRDGLVHNGLAGLGEAFAQNAYRLFPALWGNEADIEVGPWRDAMASDSFTWAHINGSGTNSAVAAGQNQMGILTSEMLANSDINTNAIFWQMFGSWNGDWGNYLGNDGDNLLMSTLASGYGLAAAWTGRPNWFFHHTALGETIGYSARLTKNNTGLYAPVGFFPNRAHIGLLGDPTLRMFPVLPATNVRASYADGTVKVEWDSSADSAVSAYYIYGSANLLGPYRRLAAVGDINEWSHAERGDTRFYMVRARKLQVTGSGSFYNLAQGAFSGIYTVEVAGGSADRPQAFAGETVTITADALAGRIFRRWTSTGSSAAVFADSDAASTTFVMPAGNVRIAAMFDDGFTVTVTGGSSNPAFGVTGTSVVLSYGTPPDGKRFKEWRVVSGGVTVTNNSFVIGESDIAIEAVWEERRGCGCGSVSGLAGSAPGAAAVLGLLFISAVLLVLKKRRIKT